MRRNLVDYATLNARQQEAYNFHKVAARLADFGYMSALLSDDYGGADFLAIHVDGEVMKVQLKGRFTIDRKYLGKGLHVAFRMGDEIVLYDHDVAVARLTEAGKFVHTASWQKRGLYHVAPFPGWARETFADCFL